jgi:hypothetical protein
MTMHRRPVGRTRLLAAIGALIALAGCFLPWWTFGGRPGEVPALSGNAFDSLGILVFAAAIATLALVTLPFASERPVTLDRWSSYAIFVAVGWLGLAYRVLELGPSRVFSFAEPAEIVTRIPGLWLSIIGLIVLTRAAYEMLQEPRLR